MCAGDVCVLNVWLRWRAGDIIEAHGVALAVPTSSVALTRAGGGGDGAADVAGDADAGGAAVPAAKPYSW
jgi:hypothetical protein